MEDEEVVREVACLLFNELQFRTLSAQNGQHGIELFKIHHQQIRLVMVDLKMPGINGLATIKEMQAIDEKKSVFILTSGYAADIDIDSLKGKEINDFLQKPYHLNDLKNILKKALIDEKLTLTST